MIKKSINLLKENPALILVYAVNMIIPFLVMFLLYPKNLNQFTDPTNFDFVAYKNVMAKLLLADLIILVFGLIFTSGYGSMVVEAISTGKTSVASFFSGMRRFFIRILLSFLLLFAFAIGYSIIISLISTPFIIMQAINGSESIESFSIIVTLITMTITILVVPFIILWFPAILTEDIGVIQGMKNGFKAGYHNYLKLLLAIATIYSPVVVYIIFNYGTMSNGDIFTPALLFVSLLDAIIVIVVYPILFMIYRNNSQRVSINSNIPL